MNSFYVGKEALLIVVVSPREHKSRKQRFYESLLNIDINILLHFMSSFETFRTRSLAAFPVAAYSVQLSEFRGQDYFDRAEQYSSIGRGSAPVGNVDCLLIDFLFTEI